MQRDKGKAWKAQWEWTEAALTVYLTVMSDITAHERNKQWNLKFKANFSQFSL